MFRRIYRPVITAAALAIGAPTYAAEQSTPPISPPPPACAAPEHRQFDFWVGRWDVYRTGTEKLVAQSLIEKLYGGCVIRENWMPLRGPAGGSVNNYVTDEQRWHQTWVSGSNARVEFHGGRVGDKMILTGFWKNSGGAGKHGLIRMTYSKLPDGSVRQLGELSTDHGATWTKSFDFNYRPAKQ